MAKRVFFCDCCKRIVKIDEDDLITENFDSLPSIRIDNVNNRIESCMCLNCNNFMIEIDENMAKIISISGTSEIISEESICNIHKVIHFNDNGDKAFSRIIFDNPYICFAFYGDDIIKLVNISKELMKDNKYKDNIKIYSDEYGWPDISYIDGDDCYYSFDDILNYNPLFSENMIYRFKIIGDATTNTDDVDCHIKNSKNILADFCVDLFNRLK